MQGRLQKDIDAKIREKDVISRSLERISLYEKLETLTVNVSDISQEQVAEIFKLNNIPESEMQEVKTFEQLPDNLTYPAITPVLFAKLEHTGQSLSTKNELVIDLHNYIEDGSVFKRTAARGIIQKNGRYLLIHSKYGDHKFPGGGMNDGETLEQTLVREVQEETSYVVAISSISEGFVVSEKRKGHLDDT